MCELRHHVDPHVIPSLTTGSSQSKRSAGKLLNCTLPGMARRRRGSRLAKRLNAHFDLEGMIMQLLFEQDI